MMWSKSQLPTHPFPFRVYGPNNYWECICTPEVAQRIDDKYGHGLNIWLSAAVTLDVAEWLWSYAAASTLNQTLLRRLLTVRTEWSRK